MGDRELKTVRRARELSVDVKEAVASLGRALKSEAQANKDLATVREFGRAPTEAMVRRAVTARQATFEARRGLDSLLVEEDWS